MKEKIALKIAKGLIFIGLFAILLVLVLVSTPSLLQSFSLMLLILTIGKYLDSKKNISCKLLKYLIYMTYLVYSLYSIGIFTDILSLTLQDWNKILFGVIAPICLVILGKILTFKRIRGVKIFNFYTLSIIYIIIAFIWSFLYPEEIVIEFAFLYWIILLLITYIIKNTKINGPVN